MKQWATKGRVYKKVGATKRPGRMGSGLQQIDGVKQLFLYASHLNGYLVLVTHLELQTFQDLILIGNKR